MAQPLGGRGGLTAAAQLLDDGGRAAEQDDFFRSRAFYDAEAVTHTLLVEAEGTRLAIPVLVREIPGTARRDAVSPYGYPGGVVSPDPAGAAALALADVDWAPTGLVSVFVRDRVGAPPCFRGATERSTVQISDPELPRKSRMSDRQQIRRNERAGYAIASIPGPQASAEQAGELHRVYVETMLRAGAEQRYLFGASYFEGLLSSPRTWLFSVRGPDGDVAAAAIAADSDGIVHYYLSGTADAHREASPSKNLIVAVIEFAESRGAPMNLGGGVEPGDGLEAFKRGFANRELPFHTHEIVCEDGAYEELSAGREQGAFFPAYRAPSG